MQMPRVIPCLLLKGQGLVKTVQFKNPKYVGDPINAVKIFNDKEVDELLFLDIEATRSDKGPQMDVIANIASECFMPIGYGGGVRSVDQIRHILNLGVEKVVLNTAAFEVKGLVEKAATVFGSQSIVVAIDIRRRWYGKYEAFTRCGKRPTGEDAVTIAKRMESNGAGELFLNSIDHDGAMKGFDIECLRAVTGAVSIPVVACGGAGTVQHLSQATDAGASAVSAGSMFVFQGPHRAVLISYPERIELEKAFS